MLEFAIAFSLAFGPADAGWTLDIHPSIVMEIENPVNIPMLTNGPRCGIALPHIAFAKVGCGEGTAKHELGHLEQYSAIGPGIALLQVFSGGAAVEDYIGHEGSTWFPEEHEKNFCPALRITSDETVRFMPCWNPF